MTSELCEREMINGVCEKREGGLELGIVNGLWMIADDLGGTGKELREMMGLNEETGRVG